MSSDEVESISKVVNIQIEVSQATILFGELAHFSSHIFVASHTAHRIVKESMQCFIKLFGFKGQASNGPIQFWTKLGGQAQSNISSAKVT